LLVLLLSRRVSGVLLLSGRVSGVHRLLSGRVSGSIRQSGMKSKGVTCLRGSNSLRLCEQNMYMWGDAYPKACANKKCIRPGCMSTTAGLGAGAP
jgi:hypothetical protein